MATALQQTGILAAEPGQEEVAARALVRAHRAGLQIVGRGFTRGPHPDRCFAVTSATVPDLCHIVTVRDLHLACSCTAGQFHRACAHAALVRSHLVAERFASSDYRLEQQEQALHTAARRLARQVAHSDPEHAPLLPVNAGRPISIFK